MSPILIFLTSAAMAAAARERARSIALARSEAAGQDRARAARRLVRLTANDLRGVALKLLGHADTRSTGSHNDTTLDGLGQLLLSLSADLLAQTEEPDAGRRIDPEALPLLPIVQFAVAQIAAQVSPGQRSWKMSPHLETITLHADRRAMNQIMLATLSNAAAHTRDGDWIEITTQEEAGCWCLIIQDEGAGLPVSRVDGRNRESRGIGVSLSLACRLMAAHGGALTIESAARVGTRVRLSFPNSRVGEIGAPTLS